MVDDYGNNVLMFASMECKIKAMNYFIRYGIDINATNKQKETALMKVICQPYERLFQEEQAPGNKMIVNQNA